MDSKFIRKLFFYFPLRLFIGILGFIPLLLLTNNLEPEQYGTYKIVFIIVTMSVSLIFGWLEKALVRYWNLFSDKAIAFRKIVYLFLFTGTIPFIIIAFITTQYNQLNLYLFVVILIFLISKAIFSLGTAIQRTEEMLMAYNIAEFMRTGCFLFLLYLLINEFQVNGALFAISISFGIGAIISLIGIRKKIVRTNNLSEITDPTLKELFVYGFPLTFTLISGQIIASSDQLILSYFYNREYVGIYAANYDLLSKTIMFVNGILVMATTPKLINIYDSMGEKEAQRFNTIVFQFLLIMIICITGILIFNIEYIFTLIIDKNYYKGLPLIIILIMGIVLSIFASFIVMKFNILKNTKVIAYIYLITAGINIILNFIFVPRYHFYGAAYATLISYVCLVLLSIWFSKGKTILNLKPSLIYITVTFLVYSIMLLFGIKGIVATAIVLIYTLTILLIYVLQYGILNKLWGWKR